MESYNDSGGGLKRALKWVGILVLLVLLLVAVAFFTFPYWFGAALSAGGKQFGVSFSKYERLDNGRFALTDVVRTNALFDLRVSRIEGFSPAVWYRNVRATNHARNFVEVNGWRVVLREGEKSDGKGSTNQPGVYGRWKEAENYISEVRQWVPKATLLNGTVEFRNREYTFPVVTWDEGKLDAGGVWSVSAVPFEVKGKLTGELPYQVSFNMPSMDLRGRLQALETNGVLNAKLTAFYKETRADVNADFGPEGFLPQTATVKALNFKIPGDLLKLDKYNDFTGSFTGEWKSNQYQLDLKAHAEPIAGAQLPPADIELMARGDTNSVQIEKARSTAPGLEIAISDPVQIDYRGQLLSERSELKLAVNLEKLPWLKLKGQFAGTLLLKRGEKFPVATIRAAGTNVEAYHVRAERVELAGVLNWPRIEEFQLTAQLGSNSEVAVKGSGDLETRVLGEGLVRIDSAVPTNLLPKDIRFDRVKLTANFSGSISNLAHEGEIELRNLVTPQTQPMNVEGRWKAQQITFEELALRARAGPAVLFLSGRGFEEGERTNFVLRELALSKGDENYLKLADETTITLGKEQTLEMTPLRLAGNDRELVVAGALRWPQEGRIEIGARNINPTLFQSFVTRSLRDAELREIALAAGWTNGPLFGKLSGSFSVAEEHFQRLGADVKLGLDEAGLMLEQAVLWDSTGQIGNAKGLLPMSINLLERPPLKLARQDRIDFELHTTTNQAFWNAIEKVGKIRLTNAAVDLVVHGTTARPTGEFHATADSVQLLQTNRALPAIGPLDARIALNERALRIREFNLRVLDQPAVVTGRLALGSNFWTQRREEILKYALDNADLNVQAENVKLAPFATYLPKYLTPQGQLVAKVSIKPGRNLQGRVEVHDVETRPLPNIGVVQSIRAALELNGKDLAVQEVSGVLGGERMTLSGRVDLSPESVAKGYPNIDLAITGKNLPLARNPDVILRSDLNLQIRNGTNQIPVISGEARLRDSFLLRDISQLVPGRLAKPTMRPPYFSIEQDPVDEWQLAVKATGNQFMRVRSPFFTGVVSANFNVTGTAKEPMALGEATINEGTIIFPFATLDVRQAIVSLTTEDPYVPHIYAVALARAFGFDIRMEAEGPADKPIIQFTSVPALSSEQIVLMLTTGAIPREDFSFSNRDRVSKLAMFLGKSLWSKVHPGKPQEEKLTIRSGQDVTEQGRQTYEVEYKLTPRWSLVGEYDRFGALNANVKWRLVSR